MFINLIVDLNSLIEVSVEEKMVDEEKEIERKRVREFCVSQNESRRLNECNFASFKRRLWPHLGPPSAPCYSLLNGS